MPLYNLKIFIEQIFGAFILAQPESIGSGGIQCVDGEL